MSKEFAKKLGPSPVIIDVHHHITPGVFLDKCKNTKIERDPSLPPVKKGALFMDGNVPHVSIDTTLEFMERTGVTFAITSITAEESNYHQPLEKEIEYFQQCNDYQMGLVKEHPNKFGAFLNFPLSTAEAAIESICDLDTRYGDLPIDGFLLPAEFKGLSLGDDHFIPIYEELNKRDNVVIFTHPTTRPHSLKGQATTVHPCIIEFMVMTTRTISTLLINDVFHRFPNIKWIFPHMGGAFPYIAHRFEMYHTFDDVFEELFKYKNVYFDSAGSFASTQWEGSRIRPDQILAGSDAPYQHQPLKDTGKWMSDYNIDIVRDMHN
ncbi:hypothetical protein K501DRAFT_338886, partial [Backusella circina FSU 941]